MWIIESNGIEEIMAIFMSNGNHNEQSMCMISNNNVMVIMYIIIVKISGYEIKKKCHTSMASDWSNGIAWGVRKHDSTNNMHKMLCEKINNL